MPEEISLDEPSSPFTTYKIPIILSLVGLLFLIFGIKVLVQPKESEKVQFVEHSTQSPPLSVEIKVDISGAVEKPGLYALERDSRIQDLLLAAGGLALTADREWVSKYLNLAARLADGSKIYIPTVAENKIELLGVQTSTSNGSVLSSSTNSLININTASTSELDTLPGVGEVTAGKIITNRPYGSIEELLTKKAVNKSTYEKIREKVTVY